MAKKQEQKGDKAHHLQEYYKALDKISSENIIGRDKDGDIVKDDSGFIIKQQQSKLKFIRGSIRGTEDYKEVNQYQLHFEKESMIKILLCMEKFNVEFGGFLIGTIDDKKEVINIEEIFLPRQSVSGAECVFDNDDEAFIIDRFKDKYLGIFHSHNTMGAYFSSQDEKVINEALMLKGTKFLSVVISESSTLVDRLTTIGMNQANTLLGKLLETEFIGHIFERTLDDEYIKHGINRVTVDNVDITEDELEILKGEIERFHDEVKNVVIHRVTYPLVTEDVTMQEGDIYELIYQYTELIETLYEMETSQISLIEAFVKLSIDKDSCSDALDFFANAEEIRESLVEYGFNDEFSDYKLNYYNR